MYIYFKYNPHEKKNVPITIFGEVKCVELSLFHDLHAFVWMLLGGKVKEYQIVQDDEVVSMARVVNKIFFFPFMGRGGIHIGPCYTKEKMRGKGLYPYLLNYIIEESKMTDFYMIVSENNIPSIKGVTKVGFVPFAKGHKTFLKRFVIDEFLD